MQNNYQQDPDEHERQMAQRRKNNRIILLIIGAVILIAVSFSRVPNAWIYVLGSFIAVGILLYARSIVERRYKAAARERQKEAEQDDPKDLS